MPCAYDGRASRRRPHGGDYGAQGRLAPTRRRGMVGVRSLLLPLGEPVEGVEEEGEFGGGEGAVGVAFAVDPEGETGDYAATLAEFADDDYRLAGFAGGEDDAEGAWGEQDVVAVGVAEGLIEGEAFGDEMLLGDLPVPTFFAVAAGGDLRNRRGASAEAGHVVSDEQAAA